MERKDCAKRSQMLVEDAPMSPSTRPTSPDPIYIRHRRIAKMEGRSDHYPSDMLLMEIRIFIMDIPEMRIWHTNTDFHATAKTLEGGEEKS
jgi:hypothetical protein